MAHRLESYHRVYCCPTCYREWALAVSGDHAVIVGARGPELFTSQPRNADGVFVCCGREFAVHRKGVPVPAHPREL